MNNDLHEIQLTIEQCERAIEDLQALERLRKNPDFQRLIEKGYLEDEAARLVLTRAEPTMQSSEHQKVLNRMMHGVGYFRQYLHKIYQFGNQAEMSLEAHRQTRNEIMEEGMH